MRCAALVLVLASCDKVFLTPPQDGAEDVAAKSFSTPRELPGVNTAGEEDRPTLTDDLLEVYFHRAGALWVATRTTADDAFAAATQITELSDAGIRNLRGCVSGDGLKIYFARQLGDASSGFDIHVSTRARRDQPWSPPVLVAELAEPAATEHCGWERADQLEMLYTANQVGNSEIRRAYRTTVTEAYVTEPVGALNSSEEEGAPWANADGSIVVFHRGVDGTARLFHGVRTGSTYAVRPLDELAVTGNYTSPWLSKDGRTIVYAVGLGDLYIATR